MRLHAIESIFDNHCAGKSGAEVREGIQSARLDLVEMLKTGLIKPNQIHLLGLMNKCTVYEGTELYDRYNGNPHALFMAVEDQAFDVVSEAVAASGDFNTIFTQMIHNQFIPGYETAMQSVDPLITRMPSDMKIQYHGGLDEGDEPERIPEGEHYPENSPSEKYVTIENHKIGDTASITKETLLYDKTGGMLLDKIANRSDNMQRLIRRLVIKRVQDLAYTSNNFSFSANTALNINGSTRQIYASDHSSWDNKQTNNNTVTTASGQINSDILQIGFNRLANMTNIHGRIVNLAPAGETLLVNSELYLPVTTMLNSVGNYQGAEITQGGNAVKITGIVRNVVHDPEVTSGSYYWGNFKKQFVMQEVQRMQAVNAGSELGRGIIRKWVMDAILGFGARDYRWVVKFT